MKTANGFKNRLKNEAAVDSFLSKNILIKIYAIDYANLYISFELTKKCLKKLNYI